jgi:hypothetical protein
MSGDYFAEKWAQHCYRGESLVGDGKDGFQEISFNSYGVASYRIWIRRGYALLGYGETHALEIPGLIFLSN